MIDLVEDADARHLVGADLGQHRIGDFKLAFEARITRVDDVQQQGRIERFVQGGFERGHQAMRQVLDETDGITDEHTRHAFGVKRTHGGVQRGEELVGHQHLTAGQRTHQRRLAGIGVADQRHIGEALPPLAARALGLALGLHRDDLELQFGNAVTNLAAVEFGVRLAGTAASHPAALPPLRPGELGRFAQTRCHVAKPGDLNLRLGSTRARVTVKDLEDDHGAVHDLAARLQLEVARLRGRDLVIDQQRLDRACARHRGQRRRFKARLGSDEVAYFLALANAQVTRGVKTGALLRKGLDNPVAQRLRQFA